MTKLGIPKKETRRGCTKMKKCPYCGSNQLDMETILLPTWDGKPRYVIVCECSAAGPKAESKEIAKQRWNERAP